ncbi:5'-nucleotidase [Tepiditoga spiralis]|uniref:5'-nucleotidase n=1 Tax=Tepiditoga spiralis TaxID=2108365 RepID=A0A7G1GCA4_9BACT|nr:5'-nucleotidase, lipoprotein e(P4) family [Tepiditoga spiralis]BBE32019.1 5'-nucleotidase [Tepiditoga spiralis]
MKKGLSILLIVIFALSVFASTEFYVVKSGDTVSKISQTTGVSVNDIISFNNLNKNGLIKVGQKLRLVPAYTKKDLNEQMVMALNWYQTSGEMKALSYQAFNVAKMIYDNDMKNNTSTEKRAVIVDIDETIFNNSPADAEHIGKDTSYPTGWKEWCEAAVAKALPGAVDFLNYVVKNGGDVYYISNRSDSLKEATIKNLKAEGFPEADVEHVLLKTTTSDKGPRREIVEKDHRVVLLMGDNLNDFTSMYRHKSLEERNSIVDQDKDKFGIKFVVLPNPIYGDWEGAIYNGNWGMNPSEKNKARKDHIIKYEGK